MKTTVMSRRPAIMPTAVWTAGILEYVTFTAASDTAPTVRSLIAVNSTNLRQELGPVSRRTGWGSCELRFCVGSRPLRLQEVAVAAAGAPGGRHVRPSPSQCARALHPQRNERQRGLP